MRLLLTCLALFFAAPLHAADWNWTYQDDTTAVAHRIADDGTTYLVGNTPADTHVITRLRPDGTVAWRREHAGVWTQGRTGWPRELDSEFTRSTATTLEIGSDRLCLYGGDKRSITLRQTQYAACYRIEDGAALGRFAFDELKLDGTDDSYSLLLADGGFVSVTAGTTGYDVRGFALRTVRHRRFSATGALLHDVAVGVHGFRYIDGHRQDGSVLFRSDGSGPEPGQTVAGDPAEYRVVDADGVRRFDLDTDLAVPTARLAPDGTIHLVGRVERDGRMLEWRHIGREGQELSRRTFDVCNGCPSPVGPFFGEPELTIDRSDVFLTTRIFVGESRFTGFGFSRDSRNLTIRLTAPAFEIAYPGFLRIDPATRAPLAAVAVGSFVGVNALDETSGAVLRTRFLTGCRTCSAARLRVSDDGTVRLIAETSSNAGRLRVTALANAWAARAPTRLDQPGLRGAWYAPYMPGQGFVVEYLPATNTLFIPWFTYTSVDQSAPVRNLRWYSLQGRVPPSAMRATLDILLNPGGAFASPPETQPTAVGTATFEAYDCDSATLEYDLGSGPQVISLSRLTPATEPCVLADGTTRGSAPPARDGFDARQSGAWFTRGRAGQGLTFAVQPGGSFFGAWFTYDPATSPDDPATQHWFSLQGDLSTATNGRVTLPILRTTGGSINFPTTTTTVAVGTATITFTACGAATLDYAFEGSSVAGNFGLLAGTLALEKLGGCTN